jgi:hypothetical protein
MRARICAGMKRYFHTKQTEGLLSSKVTVEAQGQLAAATGCGAHRAHRCCWFQGSKGHPWHG